MDIINISEDIQMTSLEVVDLINRFRKEEGKKAELTHGHFLRDIRKEIETLESVGISTKTIFGLSSYDDGVRNYAMYILKRDAILQMLNKESALVRYRTQEYIRALEDRLKNIQASKTIEEKDKQIERLESLIGLRTKEKFQYGKIIKNHLGTTKADKDYQNIKQMFFYELGVEKWEDITYNRKNVILLNEICEDYKPSFQLKFNL